MLETAEHFGFRRGFFRVALKVPKFAARPRRSQINRLRRRSSPSLPPISDSTPALAVLGNAIGALASGVFRLPFLISFLSTKGTRMKIGLNKPLLLFSALLIAVPGLGVCAAGTAA
jgi:hypothetical protein